MQKKKKKEENKYIFLSKAMWSEETICAQKEVYQVLGALRAGDLLPWASLNSFV